MASFGSNLMKDGFGFWGDARARRVGKVAKPGFFSAPEVGKKKVAKPAVEKPAAGKPAVGNPTPAKPINVAAVIAANHNNARKKEKQMNAMKAFQPTPAALHHSKPLAYPYRSSWKLSQSK